MSETKQNVLLNIKKIFNPLSVESKVTKEDIENLKQWTSVWYYIDDPVLDSIWNSVGDFAGDFVRNSVYNSVWHSVGDVLASVWASVRDSVWDSIGDVWYSIGDSVKTSVKNSVEDSIWAYYFSFFDINDFKQINKLWNRGFVPSFDGTTWRLHSGKNAKIVFSISKEDLMKL
jgi:hypothetical protein